jgi:hypothetical protein
MSALPTLITEAETKATAIKAVLDDLVTWLNNVRNDMQRCETELEQKRRVYDTETARYRADIQRLQSERADEERKLAQVQKTIEREKKEIGMEKERLFRSLDEVLAR